MGLFAPTTVEKFRRFRKQRRAWVSLLLLTGIFVASLVGELIAHGTPWLVKFEGRLYFPRFQTVPRDAFLEDGVMTEPDFHELADTELFSGRKGNWMLWAPIRFSPDDTVSPERIELADELRIQRRRVQRVAELRVNPRLATRPGYGADWFLGEGGVEFPEEIHAALRRRFENEPAPALEVVDDSGRFVWSISAYEPRPRPPRGLRLLLRERMPDDHVAVPHSVPGTDDVRPGWWTGLPEEARERAEAALARARTVPVDPVEYTDGQGTQWKIRITKETVQFPFRPVKHHPLGLDQSGRDVLVLILYATRISLLFGFLLVIFTMLLGTLLGGLQGYFGGWTDLIGQRVVEVYSAIPFLYAMIYLGSIFGRSFGLLLFVYALFNWIGISYYMRAEFLKLRGQPFTEAARSLGLPTGRIMWRHILPNALVPLITFFPFSLVGAIGSLSALDFLGFGLPVGTPSWGDLLSQAQTYRYAWWLILYPTLILFTVILLGVFIGEGLRSAFDPKRETHWEA